MRRCSVYHCGGNHCPEAEAPGPQLLRVPALEMVLSRACLASVDAGMLGTCRVGSNGAVAPASQIPRPPARAAAGALGWHCGSPSTRLSGINPQLPHCCQQRLQVYAVSFTVLLERSFYCPSKTCTRLSAAVGALGSSGGLSSRCCCRLDVHCGNCQPQMDRTSPGSAADLLFQRLPCGHLQRLQVPKRILDGWSSCTACLSRARGTALLSWTLL